MNRYQRGWVRSNKPKKVSLQGIEVLYIILFAVVLLLVGQILIAVQNNQIYNAEFLDSQTMYQVADWIVVGACEK